jgi:putative redox protein
MKIVLNWNAGMAFEAQADGHSVHIDAKAPLGRHSGPTPKELVAMGLGGCTAMDVIALLKKHKQSPTSFKLTVEITSSQGRQPVVFEEAILIYSVFGAVEAEVVLESIRLSQTQYCGVSAMLSQSFPIGYRVELNGSVIGSGRANFKKRDLP